MPIQILITLQCLTLECLRAAYKP